MVGRGLPIRDGVPAAELRRLARRERDRAVAARMQAIAGALEGLPRAEAARLAGMERQALRDAVLRYTAYWRELLAALALAGVPAETVPAVVPGLERAPTLIGLARGGGLAPGWYLARVAGHFLLLRLHGFGLAQVFDNRLSGAVLTARTHGRNRVTHLARIAGGPLPGEAA